MWKIGIGITALIIVLGSIFLIIRERNSEIMIESRDESVLRFDEENMEATVVSGLTIDELIDSIESLNRLDLVFDVTTNEGNEKQKSIVYSYDLLIVEAKEKDLSVTYSIRTTNSFD